VPAGEVVAAGVAVAGGAATAGASGVVDTEPCAESSCCAGAGVDRAVCVCASRAGFDVVVAVPGEALAEVALLGKIRASDWPDNAASEGRRGAAGGCGAAGDASDGDGDGSSVGVAAGSLGVAIVAVAADASVLAGGGWAANIAGGDSTACADDDNSVCGLACGAAAGAFCSTGGTRSSTSVSRALKTVSHWPQVT